MNAIIAFLIWALSLLGSPTANNTQRVHEGRNQGGIHHVPIEVNGAHIMNGNPRTVVALEDTHFRPM